MGTYYIQYLIGLYFRLIFNLYMFPYYKLNLYNLVYQNFRYDFLITILDILRLYFIPV